MLRRVMGAALVLAGGALLALSLYGIAHALKRALPPLLIAVGAGLLARGRRRTGEPRPR